MEHNTLDDEDFSLDGQSYVAIWIFIAWAIIFCCIGGWVLVRYAF